MTRLETVTRRFLECLRGGFAFKKSDLRFAHIEGAVTFDRTAGSACLLGPTAFKNVVMTFEILRAKLADEISEPHAIFTKVMSR